MVRFFVRGVAFRRWWSFGLLVVAVLTVCASALGPVYARAVGESMLQDSLVAAKSDAGLHFTQTTDLTSPSNYGDMLRQTPAPGSVRGFPSRIEGIFTPPLTLSSGATTVGATLAWRQGFCAHLIIVHGRCPSGAGEAAVSAQAVADNYISGVGAVVTVTGSRLELGVANVYVAARVVGIYRIQNLNDPYWFGRVYLNHRYSQQAGDLIDSVFVTPDSFVYTPAFAAEMDVDYPVDAARIRLSDVAAEQRTLTDLRLNYVNGIRLSTKLPQVLDTTARDRQTVRVGTLLVTFELAVLAWLLMFQVVGDAVEGRGTEIAVAKLRGRSPARTVLFGLGEPVAILALGVPLGIGLALLVTRVLASAVMVAGIPVVLPWLSIGTGLIGFAGALVAALLAARATLTRSVLDQWRRTERSVSKTGAGLVFDLGIAAVALAGFLAVRLWPGAGQSTWTLLAPGFLLIGLGLAGVRLLPPLCRRLARRTRATRRLGMFLASRQVSRRRAGLRVAALLAVSLGLAIFAVAGTAVSTRNRQARAETELGADRVVTINYSPDRDPVAAVNQVDPAGQWAMAAATWLPDGGDSITGTVLGVQPSRLNTVAYRAAGGPGNAGIARTVAANQLPELSVHGTEVRVTVEASSLSPTSAVVQVNLRTPQNPNLNVEAQPLQPGLHTYVAAVPCATGCRLVGITWDRPITAVDPQYGTATIKSIEVRGAGSSTALNLQLDNPKSWHTGYQAGQATDKVSVSPNGITDNFTNQNGGYGAVAYAATPDVIPMVATPAAVVPGSDPTACSMSDQLGNSANCRITPDAKVLPQVLNLGLVADVTALQAALPGFDTAATWQVWLNTDAPPDAIHRLQEAGLTIQDTRDVAQRVAILARQGPALALLLLLVCACVGALLAIGATAISIGAASYRRSYELAALRAVSVPRPALRRAGVLEQLLLLGAALAIGIPGGYLAAYLALPIIPEFIDHTPITLVYIPAATPVLAYAGAFLAVMLATAVVASQSLIRAAVPSRLRTAE